jgi:hypothetical protein
MDNRKRMYPTGSARYPMAALALMLLIVVPGTTTAEETGILDRITGFFSDRFSSSQKCLKHAPSKPAPRYLKGARSATTRRALEMASKAAWPRSARTNAESAYMQLVSQAYAAGRSWFFFMRGSIADEFRDDTFAECLSDFQ